MVRRSNGVGAPFDGRLYQAEDGAAKRRFIYDGSEIIAEYTTSNVMEKRYITMTNIIPQ